MKIKDTSIELKSKLGLGSFENIQPVSFIPTPTENDYRIGYIDRYIVSRVNMNQIIEVSKDMYDTIIDPIFVKYTFKWKITGTLNNKYNGRMLLQEGVIDYNKKQIDILTPKAAGIRQIFNNYIQFYKPS